MTMLDDATTIITNLIKIDTPVPANNITEETDEDKINSFTDKLIKSCAYLESWSHGGFVSLVKNEVLTLTTTTEVDGVITTDFIYNLDEIISFPQGVIAWLISNGSDIEPDQETKFGDGKNFLPEYALYWTQAGFDIARYWDGNNITPSESILGGQSIVFSDSHESSFTKDKDEIQAYVPLDAQNKLFSNSWQAFVNGNDLPESMRANQFVKKTELATTNKNVLNNTNKIAEFNREILKGQTTLLTGVSDPLSESIDGTALTQQRVNQQSTTETKAQSVEIVNNGERIDNVEDQLNLNIFKLVKNGDKVIPNLAVGFNYFDWADWILTSELFEIDPADSTYLRLKQGVILSGSLLQNFLNLYLIMSGISGQDNGDLTVQTFDINKILLKERVLTSIKVDPSMNSRFVNFPLTIELTAGATFHSFRLAINVTNAGFGVTIRGDLTIAESIVTDAGGGNLNISLDDYVLKNSNGLLFKTTITRDSNGVLEIESTNLVNPLLKKQFTISSFSINVRSSFDGGVNWNSYIGGDPDNIISLGKLKDYTDPIILFSGNTTGTATMSEPLSNFKKITINYELSAGANSNAYASYPNASVGLIYQTDIFWTSIGYIGKKFGYAFDAFGSKVVWSEILSDTTIRGDVGADAKSSIISVFGEFRT